MKSWDARKKEHFVLSQNGQITLDIDYVVALDWTTETRLHQFVDRKRRRVYLLDTPDNITKLPPDQFVCAVPLIGQTFRLSENKTVTISRKATRELGWEIGGSFRQMLDRKLRAVIIEETETKLEDENGTTIKKGTTAS